MKLLFVPLINSHIYRSNDSKHVVYMRHLKYNFLFVSILCLSLSLPNDKTKNARCKKKKIREQDKRKKNLLMLIINIYLCIQHIYIHTYISAHSSLVAQMPSSTPLRLHKLAATAAASWLLYTSTPDGP